MKLLLLFLIYLFTINSFSQQLTVTAGNVSAVSGDSVIVPINVQNFLSVGAITIKIQYTPSVLSWGRALNWDPQLSGALANATNGVVTIAWDAIAGMSINDGKLVDLKFLYNGDSTVMDFLEGQCEIADINGNIISTTYINGSVNELPSITVTKPIYGEIWVSGTADTIRWISSTAITNVKISYKRSTQSTWYTIISSTPNDGSYVWSLPPATGTSLLRIKVESTMDPNVFGISDEFIITEPISSPTNLSGQINYNPLYVELMWNDNSNNEDGFIIERETMLGDSYLVIDSVGPNINTYTDTTISYLTFNYRVKAFNQYINSTYSEPIQIIIPVNLISFIVTPKDHIVEIEWKTATELNNKGFEIERKINQEWEKIFFITGAGTTTEMKRYLFLDRLENSFIKGTVKYKLKQIDYNGLTTNLIEAELIIDFTPKEFSLSQNFPNPFNSTTTIIYSVPTESRVRISLLSILGEEIKVLVDDQVSPGNHKYTYSAYELSTGIYFVKMEAGSFTQYRKIILLK